MLLSTESSNNNRPWPTRIRKTASWLTRTANPVIFAAIMGTGSMSILFHAFPYGHNSWGMMGASLAFLFLNTILFIILTAFFIAKLISYPAKWSSLAHNPVTSLYLGCFPMGATTLLNTSVEIVHTYYGFGGRTFLYFIWAMWWIVVAISVACCWLGVHTMFVKQNHSFSTMTAMWLLPVVTLIVTSSSGGVLGLALHQYSPHHALVTAIFSAFLVSIGLTLALMIMTLYLARLIIHGLPPGASVLSVFLPLGPTGQSGFAMYLLAQNFKILVPYEGAGTSAFLSSPIVGEILSILCLSASFILWSLATMWLLYALLALHSTVLKSPVQFRLSFWGLVFPNGVYANLTIALSQVFDSKGFRIYGSIYAVGVMCVWTLIAIRSLIELKRVSDEPYLQEKVESSSATSHTDVPIGSGH